MTATGSRKVWRIAISSSRKLAVGVGSIVLRFFSTAFIVSKIKLLGLPARGLKASA